MDNMVGMHSAALTAKEIILMSSIVEDQKARKAVGGYVGKAPSGEPIISAFQAHTAFVTGHKAIIEAGKKLKTCNTFMLATYEVSDNVTTGVFPDTEFETESNNIKKHGLHIHNSRTCDVIPFLEGKNAHLSFSTIYTFLQEKPDMYFAVGSGEHFYYSTIKSPDDRTIYIVSNTNYFAFKFVQMANLLWEKGYVYEGETKYSEVNKKLACIGE